MRGQLLSPGLLGSPISRVVLPTRSYPRTETFAVQFFTAPVGTNTKSSYSTISNGFTNDCDGFYLNCIPGVVGDFLADIAIGGAGSEVIIVSNVLINGRGTGFVDECSAYIPLPVRAGTRIAARIQSTDASAGCTLSINPVRGGIYRQMRCTQSETLGANTGDSGGVSVDPGGTINTKGAYSQITASTSRRIRQMLICIGGQNNATRTDADHIYDVAVGGAGSEVVVMSDIVARQSATVDGFMPTYQHRFVNIAAGSRIAVRGQSSINDATDRLSDVAIVGFS